MHFGKLRKNPVRYTASFLGRWVALAGLFMAAAALPAQIRVEAHEPAILRGGDGALRMKVVNDGKTAVPLDFTVGTFYDDTARTKIEAPKITFSLDSGGNLPLTLAPRRTLTLRYSWLPRALGFPCHPRKSFKQKSLQF